MPFAAAFALDPAFVALEVVDMVVAEDNDGDVVAAVPDAEESSVLDEPEVLDPEVKDAEPVVDTPLLLVVPLLEPPLPSPAAAPLLPLVLPALAVVVLTLPVLVAHPNFPLLMLIGTATMKVVPALAKVEVNVRAPVTVIGIVVAETRFCAFAIAPDAIGTPARLQPRTRGWRRSLVSRVSSQLDLMQVITSVRKLPLESRQMHATSIPLHVKSPEFLMQS